MQQEFINFLDKRKEEVINEANNLLGEDRADEGNVLKAKSNIYDIAKSVFNTVKQEKFAATFGNITGRWNAALEQAKKHNDIYNILIEEAKKSAVDEINNKFSELF